MGLDIRTLLDVEGNSYKQRRNTVIEIKPTVEQLKEEIDDLRKQWDYLNSEGSQAEKQRIITNQIERI